MKIAFITTIDTNIGDDFVREGIKYLLKKVLNNENIDYSYIDKSAPIMARYGFDWIKKVPLYKTKLDKLLPLTLTKDKILESDLVIQSGAPVYWCHPGKTLHCYNTPWFEPIKRRLKLNSKSKLFNLAAGTCQNYFSTGNEFCPKCLNYIEELYNLSEITTVRDLLAKNLLASININVPLIPCTSIFAKDNNNLKSNEGEYVVLNYMEGAGHYNFNNKVDIKKWENLFVKFYKTISNYENIIFVCHNKKEVSALMKIIPKAKYFYSKYYIEYLKFYSKAKFAIVNRVHSAFILASFGKPTLVIGNDSRARMTSEIGVENIFVNDADYEYLMNSYSNLKKSNKAFIDNFMAIKESAFTNYVEVLQNKLN